MLGFSPLTNNLEQTGEFGVQAIYQNQQTINHQLYKYEYELEYEIMYG